MKKLLLSFSLMLAFSAANAQNLVTENFDVIGNPPVLPAGWQSTNQSNPVGTTAWFQGGASATLFAGFNGGQTGYIGANFNNTTGAGTISNWLITPSIDVQNGDVVTFYTRKGTYAAAPTPANTFPDRLEFRYSTVGEFTTNPSTGINDVADFTNLALQINPNLDLTGYPDSWTQYSYTVTGLTGVTSCKFAFRYYVTNGGPSGANSDYIGLDAFSVDRALATDSFFKGNFSVSPNPANDVLNIANHTNIAVNAIQITDMNGRVVREVKGMTNQINVSELNAGVYFLKVTTDQGAGTTKIIKK